jgi:LPS-assembly protein
VPRGVLANQHEVAAGVGLPLADYWRGTAHLGWDLANNTWLDAGAGVRYDDGYLEYGGDITATGPTNIDANDLRVTASFSLKGLGGALPERVVPALW